MVRECTNLILYQGRPDFFLTEGTEIGTKYSHQLTWDIISCKGKCLAANKAKNGLREIKLLLIKKKMQKKWCEHTSDLIQMHTFDLLCLWSSVYKIIGNRKQWKYTREI